jgi:hypothetical protein
MLDKAVYLPFGATDILYVPADPYSGRPALA